MAPFTFVLVALAAYRLTRFVVADSLLAPQRRWLFERFPPSQGLANVFGKDHPSRLGQLIDCPYCIGFWISGLCLWVADALGYVHVGVATFLALWWAVAGAQAMLNAADRRLSE